MSSLLEPESDLDTQKKPATLNGAIHPNANQLSNRSDAAEADNKEEPFHSELELFKRVNKHLIKDDSCNQSEGNQGVKTYPLSELSDAVKSSGFFSNSFVGIIDKVVLNKVVPDKVASMTIFDQQTRNFEVQFRTPLPNNSSRNNNHYPNRAKPNITVNLINPDLIRGNIVCIRGLSALAGGLARFTEMEDLVVSGSIWQSSILFTTFSSLIFTLTFSFSDYQPFSLRPKRHQNFRQFRHKKQTDPQADQGRTFSNSRPNQPPHHLSDQSSCFHLHS